MSVSENNRAALFILSQQLAQLTYGEYDKNGVSHTLHRVRRDTFIVNFELILDAIQSLTHDCFSAPVKKTMLVSQFRGYPRETVLKYREDWNNLTYEQFVAFVGDMVAKGMI